MPARGSLFQRTEILFLLLAVPLFTAGCGPRQIWGAPEDGLRSDLARGSYSALSTIDFSSRDPAQCLALSPSAPYYLSFVFDSLDKPAESLRLLEVAWQRSPSPWKEEAGILLARRYLARKEYDKAIDVARRVAGSSAAAEVQQKGQRVLVEALYWSRQDEAVLREAERLGGPEDPEVLLFRAVSSLRLGLPAARDLTVRLFLQQRVSSLHGRVYTFIAAEPAYLQVFSAQDLDLLAGKNALVQGDWSRGIGLLEGVLASINPVLVADGALVADLGSSYVFAGTPAAGARFMEKLAVRLTGQARTDAEEQAGRLYRRSKEYSRALPWLRRAVRDASSSLQRDRVRWLILDILFAIDDRSLPRQVAEEAAGWSDAPYFSDLLRGRIAELITGREWKTLAGLWRALDTTGPDDVRAQLSYVLAREMQEGVIRLLPGGARGDGVAVPPVTARELFQDAERRDPAGYYGILAASMLGDLPDKAVPATASTAVDVPGLDPVAMGFLPYGLTAQAWTRLWGERDSLSEAQVLEAARQLAQAGDFRSSMYLIGSISRRRRLTLAELEMYYPRGYADLVEPLARGAGIPDHILYGLVREESYFDQKVTSSAGAVGLSQLMPSTAASVAQKLRIVDPDLRDPATNLAIGVRHLKDLLASTGSTTKALLAYNAGLTRLRQWERASPGLPADLFVESAAIAETRDYVRKILVSSVMYAFLYRDTDPRDAALSFFSITRPQLGP